MSDETRQLEEAMDSAGAAWREEHAPSADFSSRLKASLLAETSADVREIAPPAHSRTRYVLTAAAAVLLAVAGIGYWSTRSNREHIDLLYAAGSMLSSNTTFTNGDAIQTGAGAQAILWSDEQRVTLFLSEETEIHVIGEDRIALASGELWVNIEPNSGFYEVTTPNAAVTVKGTRFGVKVGPEGTRVSIESGEVTVKAGEQVEELIPGKIANIPGEGTTELETSSAERPEWVVELEKDFMRSAAARRYPSGWSGKQP